MDIFAVTQRWLRRPRLLVGIVGAVLLLAVAGAATLYLTRPDGPHRLEAGRSPSSAAAGQ